MLFVAHHLFVVAAAVWLAWVLGEAMLGRPSNRAPWCESPGERALLAVTLGVGTVAQGVFVLGLVGLLAEGWLLGAAFVAVVVCRRAVSRVHATARAVLAATSARLRLVSVVAVLPAVGLALYPPTGFDASVYHLPYVTAFRQAGALVFVEGLRFPVFPQLAEMIFLAVSTVSSDVAPRLSQVVALALSAAWLVAWGRRAGNRPAGSLAAMLWLGTPLAVWIGSQAYVDVSLTLFVTASLYAHDRWRSTGDERWLVAAGAFVGFAAATKYLGLFFVAWLGAQIAWHVRRRARARRGLVVFVLAVAVVAGPWYARIAWHTGNPLFPFYESVFGDAGDWSPEGDRPISARAPDATWQDDLVFVASLPVTSVWARQRFGDQAPLSPWLPVLFLGGVAALTGTVGRRRALLVLAYVAFWTTTARDLRFLLPITPLASLWLVAGTWDGLTRWVTDTAHRRRIASVLALLLLAPGWGYALHKLASRGPLPVSPEARRAYLGRQVPGVGLLHRLADAHGDDVVVYGLFAEHLRHHASGRFLGDRRGAHRYQKVTRHTGDPGRVAAVLRGMGADHLLVREVGAGAVLTSDPGFRSCFRAWGRDGDYALYRVPPACPAPAQSR